MLGFPVLAKKVEIKYPYSTADLKQNQYRFTASIAANINKGYWCLRQTQQTNSYIFNICNDIFPCPHVIRTVKDYYVMHLGTGH